MVSCMLGLGQLFRGLLVLLLLSSAIAQTTSPANASASATDGARVVTTAIATTLFPSGTTGSPIPTSLVLTLTLAPANTTAAPNRTSTAVPSGATPTTIIAPSGNETAWAFSNGTVLFNNGTRLFPNGTEVAANGTVLVAGTQPYDGNLTLGLPFHVALDPAYGVAGAVLIISGGFVGVLGGKNRWSSMAIVSGYVLLLFTLVMILSLGVEPALAPPSPDPPSSLTRGLYTLACIIAAVLGSAIGIFFWRYAKYLVCGAGGFAVGWFVLALHTGGVASGNLIARWGIIGGLFVVTFVTGLWESFHIHLVILATSWIGATAVTLGIDCYARTGLKEFYIYNLGYAPLFQSLNGHGYPLLVNMQIMLGVLAALFLIFAAIQYRVLGILHTKLKQIQKEDRERKEKEDEEKNAERFKELGRDLEKWEGKHGTSGGSRSPMDPASDTTIPVLDQYGRTGSQLSLDTKAHTRSGLSHEYGSLPLDSPMSPANDRQSGEAKSLSGQSVGMLPVMQLGEPISPGMPVEPSPVETDPELREKMQLLAEIQKVKQSIETIRATPSPNQLSPMPTGNNQRASRVSFGPMSAAAHVPLAEPAERRSRDAEWQDYLNSRKLYTPPGGISPPIAASTSLPSAAGRLSRVSPAVIDAVTRRERTMSAFELGGSRESGYQGTQYEREAPARTHRYSSTSQMQSPIVLAQASARRSPEIVGHAALSPALDPSTRRSSMPPRTFTYDELTARHKAKIKQLQQPITETLKSEVEVQEAKADFERRRISERRASQVLSTERTRKDSGHQSGRLPADRLQAVPAEDPLVKAAGWRQSLGAAPESPAAQGNASQRSPQSTTSPQGGKRHSTDMQSKRVSRGPHQVIN